MQVIGKSDGRGQEGFKGRLLDVFQRGTLEAGIQVLVEILAQIDFIEGIGGLGFNNVRLPEHRPDAGRGIGLDAAQRFHDGAAFAVAFRGIRGFGGHFQNRLVGGIAGALGFQSG